MNRVDIIIVSVVVLFGALGVYWGIIRQALAIVGLIAGIVLANRYHIAVAGILSSVFRSETLERALAFLIVLMAVSSLVSLLATLLRRFVGLLFLGRIDHVVGGLLGLLQGLMMCAVLLMTAAAFPNDLWSTALVASQLAPMLVRVFNFLLILLPEPFRFATQITFGVS